MPCMNSRYHCNSLQSLHFIDITHIECTQRSRDRDPTLQQVAEANYVCVQTSLTNGIRVSTGRTPFNSALYLECSWASIDLGERRSRGRWFDWTRWRSLRTSVAAVEL